MSDFPTNFTFSVLNASRAGVWFDHDDVPHLYPVFSVPEFTPLTDRGRSVSRSNAIRRPRSPSLSKFWQDNPRRYSFFQSHFYSFTPVMADRPKISLPVEDLLLFQYGIYVISQRSLRRWNGTAWDTIYSFDSIDLMTSFPLRAQTVYFSIVNGPQELEFQPL